MITAEHDDGVARITLDSPTNRNALSVQLLHELQSAIGAAVADAAVRVLVLTGTGPVFCSGVDVKEQRAANEQGVSAPAPRLMTEVFAALLEAPKPVLCRVNGHTRAGGTGLMASCDIVVAPQDATFGFAEVRLGIVPAVISVPVLPLLPTRAALELMLTGEPFDARRAADIGLITRAVPTDELDAEVDRLVAMLRLAAPEALRESKRLIRGGVPNAAREAFAAMLALSEERFASAEALEGMRAFLDKRPPAWAEADRE